MAKKKWNSRRAYLDEFQKTAAGEYVYTGAVHSYVNQGVSRGKALAALWALTAFLAAGALVAGCVPAAGMNTFYVLLPYVASLISAASVVWLMCRLTAGGDPLRDYVYRATVPKAALRANLTMVCAGGTLLGGAVHWARNGAEDKVLGTAAFLACEGVVFLSVFLWKLGFQRLKWKEERKNM
jgi:hypothetical protein